MTARDVEMAGLSLAAYGMGLIGHMTVKVLAPGYFARQDTRTPVRFGIFALVANIGLNLTLIWHWQHVGLALATSISAFLNAGLLLFGLVRLGVLNLSSDWGKFAAQVGIALVFMGLVLHLLVPAIHFWLSEGFFVRIVCMLLICLAGGVTYATSLFLLGLKVKQLVR